jgi:hypothetical protein
MNAMSCKRSRWRVFVDPEVQGALVTRCLIYWCVCLFVVFMALLSPEFIHSKYGTLGATPPGIWLRYAPALVLAGVLTPLMVFDLLRCTNRFAVPMVRTRRLLRSLAIGEPVEPIRFRQNDYWQDYANELNAVVGRMQMLEARFAASTEAAEEKRAWSEEPSNGLGAELVRR